MYKLFRNIYQVRVLPKEIKIFHKDVDFNPMWYSRNRYASSSSEICAKYNYAASIKRDY